MADGLTTNLSFTLPEVGASDDTWGTKLNANWSALDALFNASGYLKHESGGLEADVSAYSGLIKITGGATSAVTITAAGEALLDDADASAQRTTLGLVIGTDVQAYDAGLASIAGLTTAANKMIYTTASDTYAVTDLSAFGRTLIDDADASTARATLGLAIGTDVQAYDALLDDIAGMTLASGDLLYADGAASLAQLAKGTAGQVLTMNSGATAPEWATPDSGSWTLLSTITLTSSTTFTGIPSTASEILVLVDGGSVSGASSIITIRLGDSGGLETTGYVAGQFDNSGATFMTDGFDMGDGGSGVGDNTYGILRLQSAGSNRWFANWSSTDGSSEANAGCGVKTLTGTLDRVGLTTAIFDAGTASLYYR